MALADENSPVFLAGAFYLVAACLKDEEKITDAFRTGKGVGWHEHHPCLFVGTERFFRPNYRANLVSQWIPALGDVEAKLKAGARAADVGCGLGTSTILMAQAYPKSAFVGFDYHPDSIALAREAAAKAGVSDRVKFEVAMAKNYPGKGLRTGYVLRLSSRHGRPGRRRKARARDACTDGNLDDRRAVRQRQARRQSQSDRAGILFRIHHAVHAGFALARGRARRWAPRQAKDGSRRCCIPQDSRG